MQRSKTHMIGQATATAFVIAALALIAWPQVRGWTLLNAASEDASAPRPQRSPGSRRPPMPFGMFGSRPNTLMTTLDTDGDGELSAEEVRDASRALVQLDKDGDGSLAAEEYDPPHARRNRAGGFPGRSFRHDGRRQTPPLDAAQQASSNVVTPPEDAGEQDVLQSVEKLDGE